jgi:hypothetical protein
MKHTLVWILALSAVSPLALLSTPAHGFDLNAHEAMSRHAARRSGLDTQLRDEYGFSNGSDDDVASQNIIDWIARGSREEDTPFLRSRHHFHDPTLPWDQAGLRLLDVQVGESSVLWGQDPGQVLGGKHSWPDTRASLLRALTSRTAKERQQAYAETFRPLGHLLHLVQDAASPAHTRNDPHISLFGIGDEDGFHTWAEKKEGIDAIMAGPSTPFHSSILTLPPNPLAPIPIARILDTERYREGRIPEAGFDLGLAEYSNANFFSDDTILSDFPFPGRSRVALGEPETAPKINEQRRYFRKVGDGETNFRLAVPSALFDTLQDALADQEKGLDDKVFEDYGRLLFPRAVGYSAGLLDYFFRGTLDVQVQFADGPTASDLLELVGTNRSDDTMENGRVAIYAEDLTGRRERVLAPKGGELPDVDIATAGFEQTITTTSGQRIQFRPPFTADRYVAVYTGDLGNERRENPAGTVGAVVGKVLGGARVEAITPAAHQRQLRTAEDLYLFPGPVDNLQRVQWGDLDNTFVGVSATTPDAIEPISAFRIRRPLGSTEVPLVTESGGRATVAVDTPKTLAFPFDLPVGTTVKFSQQVQVKQLLLTFDQTIVDTFVGADEKTGLPVYRRDVFAISDLDHEMAVDQLVSFSASFPIVLDEAHQKRRGSRPRPYQWDVTEIGLDADGRVLALVQVELTEPEDRQRTVLLRARNRDTGNLEDRRPFVVDADFPFQFGPLLLAVIDVERREVVGQTATPTVDIVTASTAQPQILQRHDLLRFVGGPLAQKTERWDETSFLPDRDGIPEVTTDLSLPAVGESLFSLKGSYRSDLAKLVRTYLTVTSTPFEFDGVFAFHSRSAGRTPQGSFILEDPVTEPLTARVLRLTRPLGRLTGYLTLLGDARRIPSTPGASPEVLLRFRRAVGIRPDEQALLVRWSAAKPTESRLILPEPLPEDSYSLEFTTAKAALLTASGNSFLVDFDRQSVETFFDQDLSQEYVLLPPKRLYNIEDTRFHTIPDLRRTALPAPLVLAPPTPSPPGAYHLLTLP